MSGVVGCVKAPIRIDQLAVSHQFLAVETLVTPVILGLDVLQQHNLVLNFASRPIPINQSIQITPQTPESTPQELQPIVKAIQQRKTKICVIAAVEDPAIDLIDDCSIPDFQSTKCEQPECAPGLKLILKHY